MDTERVFFEALLYAMEGENPSKAIENQERRGQQSVVRNQRLPKKMNSISLPHDIGWKNVDHSMDWNDQHKIVTQNNISYTRQQYEKIGIIIIDEYDDLFWNVKLPEGWTIKATDHSMWNELFDNKGRKRASFFYKAAFYDREAFINFDTRYSIMVTRVADPDSDYDVWLKSDYHGIIRDGDKVIFNTDPVKPSNNHFDDAKIQETLKNQLNEYMNKNYPKYMDINAYWD